jgi:hypothetical protein
VQLELTDAQAMKLFLIMKQANWTFVLRPAAHAQASPVKSVSAANLFK